MSDQLRVLTVEDSESDAELIARRLQQAGYDPVYDRVETADEMKMALAMQGWDLVIADYNLPRFSAPAALETLKASGQDLPFIVVSGTIGEEKAVAMMKAGAHDYVMKDNLARLAPVVARELGEAEERRERRRAEEALIKSEATLNTVLKGSPAGIGLVVNRVFQWMNDKLLSMMGYSREELIGQSSRILYASEAEFKRIGRVTQTQLKRDGWGEVDTQWLRQDGCPMEIYVSVVAVDPADLSAGVVFTAMDITARKRVERELQGAAVKWQTTFDAIGEAVCLVDRESKILQCNQAMADLVVKPFSEIAGRRCGEVVHLTTGPVPDCPVERMQRPTLS
jgi:PAS domain S-box-containing protein